MKINHRNRARKRKRFVNHSEEYAKEFSFASIIEFMMT